MTINELSKSADAVLLWMPKGEQPTAADFVITRDDAAAPPYPNPLSFSYLSEAVQDAVQAVMLRDPPPGKVPWIKTGDQILSFEELKDLYRRFFMQPRR